MLVAEYSDSDANTVLRMLVEMWTTVCGCSFAGAWVELYKQANMGILILGPPAISTYTCCTCMDNPKGLCVLKKTLLHLGSHLHFPSGTVVQKISPRGLQSIAD